MASHVLLQAPVVSAVLEHLPYEDIKHFVSACGERARKRVFDVSDVVEIIRRKRDAWVHEWLNENAHYTYVHEGAIVCVHVPCGLLESLPCEIAVLEQLSVLCTAFNRFTTVPSVVCGFKQLTSLDMSANQLESLPKEIGLLLNLQWLYVGINRLAALPAEIGMLRELYGLHAQNNALTTLPSEIGGLIKLRTLRLNHNRLTTVEPIGSMLALEMLVLHDNMLTCLPRELDDMPLRVLDLRMNRLSSFPPRRAQMRMYIIEPQRHHIAERVASFIRTQCNAEFRCHAYMTAWFLAPVVAITAIVLLITRTPTARV